MIQSSGASLLSIIHDILDFSKLESGGITMENRPFDVRDCVSQVTRILEPKALEKGIRLSARCEEACPDQVVGDAGRIRQVLMNLIGNAIKFTVEGHIWVAVYSRSSGDDQVALCFSVRDTGIGIAPDQLEQIFARFIQADSSAARSYGGTGLGLAISRQLVEMMGGELTAIRTKGDGSVFSYTLQLARAEAQADAARAREPSSEPAPKAARFEAKVLIVEDTP